MALHRDLTLDADQDLVWELLTRPDDLAAWLGTEVELDPTPGAPGRVVDADGTVRHLVVEEVVHGERLRWRWWTVGDAGDASRVEIALSRTTGGTRVEVVEAPVAPAGRAQASADAGRAWKERLLQLEVLVLFAAVALRS